MNIKKYFLFSLVTIVSYMVIPQLVSAAGNQALLIGRNYGGTNIDTSIDVTNANTYLSKIYTIQKNTNPTISWVKGSNGSTKRMESDILFFSGHGNQAAMYFYNENSSDTSYEFQINAGISSGSNVGIGSYNMKNVKLAVFAGCETAKGTNNLTQYANTQGATSTLGWVPIIDVDSSSQWLKKFWQKSTSLVPLNNALSYADSFTYEDSGVKNYKKYGVWTKTLGSGTLSINNINSLKSIKDIRDNKVNISILGMNESEILKTIESWIITNIDDKFSIKNYEIDKTTRFDKTIYDIKLLINNEIKTSVGYTVFVVNDKITNIFDNIEESDIEKSLSLINNVSVASTYAANNVEIANERIDLEVYDVLSQESYKYYDNSVNKVYFVVNTELRNKENKTLFVDKYKIEIK